MPLPSGMTLVKTEVFATKVKIGFGTHPSASSYVIVDAKGGTTPVSFKSLAVPGREKAVVNKSVISFPVAGTPLMIYEDVKPLLVDFLSKNAARVIHAVTARVGEKAVLVVGLLSDDVVTKTAAKTQKVRKLRTPPAPIPPKK